MEPESGKLDAQQVRTRFVVWISCVIALAVYGVVGYLASRDISHPTTNLGGLWPAMGILMAVGSLLAPRMFAGRMTKHVGEEKQRDSPGRTAGLDPGRWGRGYGSDCRCFWRSGDPALDLSGGGSGVAFNAASRGLIEPGLVPNRSQSLSFFLYKSLITLQVVFLAWVNPQKLEVDRGLAELSSLIK